MTPGPHGRGVLDTNAVIRLAEVDPRQLPTESVITSVTLAELTVGPLVAADEASRAFGPLPAHVRAAGRKLAARDFDAMIAAVAVSRGLALYTFNAQDFAETGAEIVDLGAGRATTSET